MVMGYVVLSYWIAGATTVCIVYSLSLIAAVLLHCQAVL